MEHVTATTEWQPADRPGQVAALLALLFAPTPDAEPANDAEPARGAA